MDPISALIGAGASLVGGFMNTSSTQAINAANLQNQINMASGAYLPQLRANAEKAGFNPLAVLGQHAPSGAVQVGTDPGQGLIRAGEMFSRAMSPHNVEMERLAEEKEKTAIELGRAQISNTSIEGARNLQVLKTLTNRPDLLPTGVQEPATKTGFGIPQMEWAGDKLQNMYKSFPTWEDIEKQMLQSGRSITPEWGGPKVGAPYWDTWSR